MLPRFCLFVSTVAAVCGRCLASPVTPDRPVTERVVFPDVPTVGLIDWTADRLEVIAQGRPKQGITHPGQRELTARSAALALTAAGFTRLFDGLRLRRGVTVGQAAAKPPTVDTQVLLSATSRLAVQTEQWEVADGLFWIASAREVPFSVLRSRLAALAPPLVGAAPQSASSPASGDAAAVSPVVCDVRGMGARPCLFPALVSEDHLVLWDSAATAQPLATKIRWVSDPRSSSVPAAARGVVPLRPLRVESGSDCVAVLRRADAARFADTLSSAARGAGFVFVVEPPFLSS